MKQITFLLLARCSTVPASLRITVPASLHADETAVPLFVTKIPAGYRDWSLVSVAHEEGNLNGIGAVLGNNVAIKAYRGKGLPFPDGAIISPLCTTVTFRRRKTTMSLADPNLSSRAPPRTFSLWSRTQRSTPRRVVGGSLPS